MEREPLYGGEPDGAICGRHTKCAVEQTWGSLVTLSSWMQWFTFTSTPVPPLYLQYHTYKLGTPLSPIPSTPRVAIPPSTPLLLHSSQPGFSLAGWMCKCVNSVVLLHYDIRVRGMRTSQVTHTETHLGTDKSVWLKKPFLMLQK